MLNNAVAHALTQASEGGGVEPLLPFIIGGGVLFILLAMLAGVVAFGGGREHS